METVGDTCKGFQGILVDFDAPWPSTFCRVAKSVDDVDVILKTLHRPA